MRGSLRLGRIGGIPFGVHYTWLAIFFVVTYMLAEIYFPNRYPAWATTTKWAVGVATSLLFFTSVLAHELSHSFVAKANGIPVKSITLFVFGGVAQITREAARPKVELVMALAGPLASLFVSGLFWLLFWGTRHTHEPVAALAWWLAYINLSLAVFNMLPGFPLDGGRVLRATLWQFTGNYRRATRIASLAGHGVAYLLIFGGIFYMFLGYWVNGLWMAFIGWFLDNAASSSYRQVLLREALQGYSARDLMTTDCIKISPETTVDTVVQEQVLRSGLRCFFVSGEEKLKGMMTLSDIKRVPQPRWATTTVSEAMTPYEKLKVLRPEDAAITILERMDEENVNQLPVVKDGQLLGMVGRDSLLRLIRTRSELGM